MSALHHGTLVLDLVSYWHAGTGRGDGPSVDAVVARTKEGLPYLPGRTVKGLVREAVRLAQRAGLLAEVARQLKTAEEEQIADTLSDTDAPAAEDRRVAQWVTDWFGSDLLRDAGNNRERQDNRERQLEEARFQTKAGSLRFGSATLGDAWAAWAAAHPIERQALVRTFASTRIAADGTAADQTLRAIEISVPMTLRAAVDGLDVASAAAIGAAVPLFLRGVGSHRRRGLGRVAARLEVLP